MWESCPEVGALPSIYGNFDMEKMRFWGAGVSGILFWTTSYGKSMGKSLAKWSTNRGFSCFVFQDTWRDCHLCLKHMWFPKKGGQVPFFGIFGLRHQPWKGWPNFLEKMWHGGQKSWIESQFLILVSSINERIFLWFLCTVSISPFVSWAKICRWKSPWLGMS